MSRSGYTDDCDDMWDHIRWRGAVKSAIKGKRGQAFLKEMLDALDALPEKKLIARELEAEGAVCALGAVGRARSIDMSGIDPDDPETVAGVFCISDALTREIVAENDDSGPYKETPENRWARMREWVAKQIRTVHGPSVKAEG